MRSGKIALLLLLVALAAFGITDRAAAQASVPVTLSWTAPGDDGDIGVASRYELRYSLLPITAANFHGGWAVPNMPAPAAAGTRQSVTVSNLIPNAVYYFAMRTADERGNWSALSNVVIVSGTGQPVDADDAQALFAFSQPQPNPARDVTRLAFELPRPSHVWVEVLDVLGRRVRTLMDGLQPAGRSEIAWSLRDDQSRPLPAGMYLVRARLLGEVFLRRLAIVK
jgi:hypothetical protein